MTAILGISAFYHDSAAALIIDGEIIAAAQEERFTRKKHDASYPSNAINYCLFEADLSLSQVDYFVFYDKPFLKFERLLETYVAFAPRGFQSFRMAMPIWLREKLFLKKFLIKEIRKVDKKFDKKKILFSEHHLSHAASAFYASPFKEALILTIDGVGEWATTTVAIGKDNDLKIVKEIHFPHSLGLLYSAFTAYLGFKVNSGEYKVMGLAPFGVPRYKQLILDKLIDLKVDGSYRLNQTYFNYATGLSMVNQKFIDLFKEPVRNPDLVSLTQFHMDVAASIQAVIEVAILNITRSLAEEYNIDSLCLAGGVALNCVANSKVLNDKSFRNLWIQPASGDAGGAIGCALAAWHKELGKPRFINSNDIMKGCQLGPCYGQKVIEKELTECGARFISLSQDEMIDEVASALADGNAVGWFQGRMEFGPRSLGCRSILADPRVDDMQNTLNLKIKYRESFRPFAPSVLKESVDAWFASNINSPYMLLVDEVHQDLCFEISETEDGLQGFERMQIRRSEIPAVTHIDCSARVHTVSKEVNPLFHSLISCFNEKTGCPVVVNTSFNVRGEPIVCSPSDAFRCFLGTELDLLAIGNCILKKTEQRLSLTDTHRLNFEND